MTTTLPPSSRNKVTCAPRTGAGQDTVKTTQQQSRYWRAWLVRAWWGLEARKSSKRKKKGITSRGGCGVLS